MLSPFDTIELVTFAFNLVAFLSIYNAYHRSIDNSEIKRFWGLFLLISVFFLLNRLFTNIEVIGLSQFFNLAEHLSALAAGLAFVFVVRNVSKTTSQRRGGMLLIAIVIHGSTKIQ